MRDSRQHTPFSRYKILRYWDSLQKLVDRQYSEAMPITAEMDLHNACNHDCIWCSVQSYRESQARAALTPNQVRHIAEGLGDVGIRGVILSGSGEPTLYPAFPEAVLSLRECGIALGLETNGVGLEGPLIQVALDHFEWVRISLDAASSEVHALTHGCAPADFERILENVRNMTRLRKSNGQATTIGLNLTAYPGNAHEIVRATELARGLGVDYLSLRVALSSDHSDWVSTLEPAFAAAASLANPPEFRVLTKLRDHRVANTSLPSCRGIGLFAAVAATGDVFLCCDARGEPSLCVGNALQEDMVSIMTGRRRQELLSRMSGATMSVCKRICTGRFEAYNEMLDYLELPAPPHVGFI